MSTSLNNLIEELADVERRNERKDREIDTLKREGSKHVAEIKKLNSDLLRSNEHVQKLEAQIASLDSTIIALTETTKILERQLMSATQQFEHSEQKSQREVMESRAAQAMLAERLDEVSGQLTSSLATWLQVSGLVDEEPQSPLPESHIDNPDGASITK
eukprot:gnl/Dysnectes_brevis/8568_a15325_257.p1 GENE.gnl/Dysnectes_brevis/8568_a15325_257~~gnl/Dysnectes_brevis/8568_a15325_257.p1  ORF type:complete len:159 (-),score=8.89 gnl/Dysnectes_brevis/8568_a15325_257:92-568(-)